MVSRGRLYKPFVIIICIIVSNINCIDVIFIAVVISSV